jgi:hypothetical protein
MLEYLLALSLLADLQSFDLLERVKGALSDPLVLFVVIGVVLLLVRIRVI